MAKIRMTVVQHSCLARLLDGATIVDTGQCKFEIPGAVTRVLDYRTFSKLFGEGWIRSSSRNHYEITEAGRLAYSKATLR